MNLADIADAVKSYHPNADLDIIWGAYIYSAKEHSYTPTHNNYT